MPKSTFSESDMYLLKNWPAACRLEEAMNAVRQRYATVIGDAAKSLVDRLGEGEYVQEVSPTQKWGSGTIAFWIKNWDEIEPKGNGPYFCIGGLRLELLLSYEAPTGETPLPFACLCTKNLKKAGWDLAKLKDRIETSAAIGLADFPKRSSENEREPVRYDLPEGRAELRRLLLEDRAGFINLLVSHGERLAELAPVLTKVLADNK